MSTRRSTPRRAICAGAARGAPTDRPLPRATTRWRLKALFVLDLDANATEAGIKARYKELVKRHHPDANGGDRSSEDKLREIIQAYNYLRANKLV